MVGEPKLQALATTLAARGLEVGALRTDPDDTVFYWTSGALALRRAMAGGPPDNG